MGSVRSPPWGWRVPPFLDPAVVSSAPFHFSLPRSEVLSSCSARQLPPCLVGRVGLSTPQRALQCSQRVLHGRAHPPRVPSRALDMLKSHWPGPFLMRHRRGGSKPLLALDGFLLGPRLSHAHPSLWGEAGVALTCPCATLTLGPEIYPGFSSKLTAASSYLDQNLLAQTFVVSGFLMAFFFFFAAASWVVPRSPVTSCTSAFGFRLRLLLDRG